MLARPLLVMGGIYTWVYCFLQGNPQFEYVLSSMEIVLILLVPVLTMRVIAEERRQKTDQLLYSLPTTMTAVALGKFLAMAVVLALPLLVLGCYPLLMRLFGHVNCAMAYGNLLAFDLLACALSALGELISACTDNPTVALVLTLLTMLLCYFLSGIASLLGSGSAFTAGLSTVLKALSLFDRQIPFRAGLFDLNAILYYLVATAVSLFLTVQLLEKRRWS